MNWPRLITLGVLLGCGALVGITGPAAAQTPTQRTLIVGTKQVPPFAMKNPDGSWSGISIELLESIADELKLTYELREFDLQGLLDGVSQNRLDLAVAALSITAERETRMDFTHPFYTTGLGIAVARQQRSPWLNFVRTLLSWQFAQLIGGLVLLLLIVGLLVWLVERKRNTQHFGGGVFRGIGSGFWWAAVTMTTVGYGDKAPMTARGRTLALIWMFASLVIISSFIAGITTVLTISHLEPSVRGPQDLTNIWVATVANSTSEAYLRRQRVAFKQYPTPLQGLRAVAAGELEAMVYDAPLLRYLATTELRGKIEVLPGVFERQDYGIALPSASPLREPITRVLLDKISQSAWQDMLYRYLGK